MAIGTRGINTPAPLPLIGQSEVESTLQRTPAVSTQITSPRTAEMACFLLCLLPFLASFPCSPSGLFWEHFLIIYLQASPHPQSSLLGAHNLRQFPPFKRAGCPPHQEQIARRPAQKLPELSGWEPRGQQTHTEST